MGARLINFARELKTKIDNTVHEFFGSLTTEERDLFTATTLVENLLADVTSAEKQHKAKSTSRRASTALKPLISGIEQYAAAFDTIANASSMVLCPLWGSFRVVLHVSILIIPSTMHFTLTVEACEGVRGIFRENRRYDGDDGGLFENILSPATAVSA